MSDPGFTFGQVPTPAQWNNAFAVKQDNLGFTPVNRAGDTMTGKLNTTASIAGTAGFSVSPGVAPSVPVNGDIWITNTGMFACVNGSNVQLAAGSGVVNSGTANQLAYYAASGAAISGNPRVTVFNGALTLGVSASIAGTLILSGISSGGVTLASAAAGGSGTITLPAGTTDFSATGGASQVVKQTSVGGPFTVAKLAFTDINGTVGAAQMPALAGDVITSVGTVATTVAKIQGTTVSGVTGTGAAVLSNAPTLIAPVLGVASATNLTVANGVTNGIILTAAAGTNGSIAMGAGGSLFFTMGSTAESFAVNDHVNNTVFSITETVAGTASSSQTAFLGSMVIGAPTGGQKGSGTLNVATNIYLNNTAYTNPDFVFEHAYTGGIAKFADKPGAKEYLGLMSLSELRQFTRDNLRLPGINDEPAGVVERFDTVLAKLEEMTLYVLDLNERLEQFKADNESLRIELNALKEAK